jgi:hypothetical protein
MVRVIGRPQRHEGELSWLERYLDMVEVPDSNSGVPNKFPILDHRLVTPVLVQHVVPSYGWELD